MPVRPHTPPLALSPPECLRVSRQAIKRHAIDSQRTELGQDCRVGVYARCVSRPIIRVMNGIGVGTAVGLGTIIGLGIVAPQAQMLEYVTTFGFYGFMSGLIFHLWQMALQDWKPPFLRGR